jgi:hypothetical protein
LKDVKKIRKIQKNDDNRFRNHGYKRFFFFKLVSGIEPLAKIKTKNKIKTDDAF